MTALIITLILVGIILIITEFLIIPGFGVAGVLGIASIVASCWIAFDGYGTTGGIITVLANIFLVVIVTVLTLRSKTWKRLTLKTNIDSKADSTPENKGVFTGMKGVTTSRLAPGGSAKIENNIIEVFTLDTIIDSGIEVEVCDIIGNKVYVKQI